MSMTPTAPPASTNMPGYTPATYYQPLPQHPQPMQPILTQPGGTVIIQTIRPGPGVAVGFNPTHITCPACQAQVLTSIVRVPSVRTHCWAGMLCLFGCWPCVCLPYCMESCKSANHYCPNCNAYIGTFEN